MASRVTVATERRARPRLSPHQTSWPRSARLRLGQEVFILNISDTGALVESPHHLKPGARTELRLLGPARCIVRGRINRCRVIGIDPMTYEAAIVFEQPLRGMGSG